MITTADLRWWLDLAPTLDWRFAKTYAQSAPHDYVVLGRNDCPLTRDDFVRAAKVIATFGAPAKFYSMTGIYLTSPDGGMKWWTMDVDLSATDLINRATTERVYGVQDAPSTATPCWVDYDALAADYDQGLRAPNSTRRFVPSSWITSLTDPREPLTSDANGSTAGPRRAGPAALHRCG